MNSTASKGLICDLKIICICILKFDVNSKHYFHTSYSHIWIQTTQIKYWWSSNCVNKNNFNVILCSNDNKFTWHWNVTCCCRRNTFCIYFKTNTDWSYVLIIRTICWVSRYIICLNDSTTVYWKLVCYM